MHEYKSQPTEVINLKTPWFRSQERVLAGVCAGIARKLNLDPWLIRLGLLLSILALGVGLALYIVLAVSLPREDQMHLAHQPRLLGVCSRLSQSLGVDVGLVRAATVLIGIGSMGATLLAYLILHFLVDGRPSYSGH